MTLIDSTSMDKKGRRGVSLSLVMVLFVVALSATFPGCFSAASRPPNKKQAVQPTAVNRFGSSVVFPVTGNVYPLGYYAVSLKIGNPPKLFDFDIDTGSDFTWVQCDAPCTHCTLPSNRQYKPNRSNLVPCQHALCSAIQSVGQQRCASPNEQCDYEVKYADQGSSLGVLIKDYFPLRLINGSVMSPLLAFGCGYDQTNPSPTSPPPTAGVLGLGQGKAGILSQLRGLSVTQNVVGHCFSGRGGFLFFGNDLVPPGIVWTPMLRSSSNKHYSSGPVDILSGGKPTGIKGLQVVFDSGSSYSYLTSQPYQNLLNLIKRDLSGKPLAETANDKTLPICWKGAKPFKSVGDVKNYFTPLTLSFTNAKNVQLQLPPEAYLILTKLGNVCLGILNGSVEHLEVNVIGDIFMQDKLVMYDNEKQQIGWLPANCDRHPKS